MPIYRFEDARTGAIETVDSNDKLRKHHVRRLWFYGDPDQVFTDDTHTKLRNAVELKAVLKSQGIKPNKQLFGGLSDQSYDALCSCAGTTSTGRACGKLLLTGGGGYVEHIECTTQPVGPAVCIKLMVMVKGGDSTPKRGVGGRVVLCPRAQCVVNFLLAG
jgi:hypothetical protein